MAVTTSYRVFVVEQLEQIAKITSRKLFGGVGLYGDGYYFALIHDDCLYFKVDDTNRSDYIVAEMEPFRPFGDERAMQYYQVPIKVLEDVEVLRRWALKSIEVARNAKSKKRRKKSR